VAEYETKGGKARSKNWISDPSAAAVID